MNEVPLVFIKNGKVNKTKKSAFNVLQELHKKYGDVYVIDIDGFKRNRAHIDIYKKVTSKPFLWIDASPRCLEDVMDLVVTGAKIVILRSIMSDASFREIRGMCDIELFLAGREKDIIKKAKKFGFDGVILFNEKRKMEKDISIWRAYPREGKVIEIE